MSDEGKVSRGRPVHPGEVLREEFLFPLGMSDTQLAVVLGIPADQVAEIVGERRGITEDVALRLSRALGTSAGFWTNLQKAHDLRKV